MILQALYDLYTRLQDEPNSGISPPGYSMARVSFALNISEDGELLDVIDLRSEKEPGRLSPVEMDVPQQAKRAAIKSFFLCDNSGYVLGIDRKDGAVEVTDKKHKAMRALHEEILGDSNDPGALAVLRYLRSWNPETAASNRLIAPLIDELMSGANMVFSLQGSHGFVHQRRSITDAWESRLQAREVEGVGQCLITGRVSPVARIHNSIKGVAGAQAFGAALVSFKLPAFTSYGKAQSFNAPVSVQAEFRYVTALNFLLRSKRQRLRIGDSTVVFWAEKPKGLEEDLFAELFDPSTVEESTVDSGGNVDEPSLRLERDPRTTQMVKDALSRLQVGRSLREGLSGIDADARFFVLGLAPNSARLAVRFWYVDTFGAMVDRVGQHYADMAIVVPEWQRDFFPPWMIAKTTAPLGDSKRASPLLAGALMRAILTGSDYPQGLFAALLSRIRADGDVASVRVAMIKAVLRRQARNRGDIQKEASITVGLNTDCTDSGYLLGRLFAFLEKAQVEATPGLNATIKDRYFGAASATPGSVFPVLLRLSQHHVAKAEYGRNVDKGIEQVISALDGFPAHLSLEQQGMFVIGYYHQRQAFYQPKPSNAIGKTWRDSHE